METKSNFQDKFKIKMKKVYIDLQSEHCLKNNRCRHFGMMFMVKSYVFTSDSDPNFYNNVYNEWALKPNFPGHFISFDSNPPRHPSALIDLGEYTSFEDYFSQLSDNVIRDYNISKNNRYIFEEFCFDNFIPDIHEIHQTTLKRKKKMNPYYLRSIEEMGGYPQEEKQIKEPSCKTHYTKWYGVFRYLKNYKQGKITTNKKLIAYCGIARDGELSVVTFLFGHGDYLKNGVMFYLLLNTIQKMFTIKESPKCIHYWSMGGLEDPKIISWKKRMLCKPVQMGV